MSRPSAPRRPAGDIQLRPCLQDRRAFWLYGFEGCGKTHHLRQSADGLDAAHTVEIVSLYSDTSPETWAAKLFDVLPGQISDGVDSTDVEGIWQRWCERYAEHAEELFVVIDGWQWMPAELRRQGAERVLRNGLSCGFVACAAPRTYLRTAQVLHLDVIECPPYTPQQNSSTVRAAQCRDLLEDLTDESKRALAPLAHLPCPLESAIMWSHFDRDALLPSLEVGLVYEHIASVTVAPPLRDALTDILEPSSEQWMELLEYVWQVLCAADQESDPGPIDPALLQATLDVFAKISRALAEPSEIERAFLKEVLAGLDAHFRTLLTPTRIAAALDALELIPSRLLQAMPAARLRLAQCMTLAGRTSEADRLLDGLVRMKHTDAGKRAFLWTQMLAALGGEADGAVEALDVFLDERIEPGEPLDVVARLVLARILVTRGTFDRVIEVTRAGIRAARAHNAARDMHMLRAMEGMSLASTDERDAGIEMTGDACDALRDLGFELAHVEARHILATLYLELEAYEQVRAELDILRPEYERLRDARNLQMLEVKEHIVALLLGEEEPPRPDALPKTPAPDEWSYFAAESRFAEALHALRRDDTAAALELLHASVHEHLSSGNLLPMRRLLRHYLPLLVAAGDYAKARTLLSALDASALDGRALGELADHFIEAMWLGGDLARWELSGEQIAVGGSPTLFPRSLGHETSESMSAWVEYWENAVCGEAVESSNAPDTLNSGALAPLYRGWQKLWADDVVGSRRDLLLCAELDLEGSLFGFLRGLLHYAVQPDPRSDMLRWRSEMLEFWRRLSPMIVIQQIGFWEKLLERRRADMAPALADTLESWLDVIQTWRVEGAMLVDEALGVVMMGGRRVELGRDTVAFAALCHLAQRAPRDAPISVEELFEAVWQRPFNAESSHSNVYGIIGNLRQALDPAGARASVIHLDRGVGYSLDRPVLVLPAGR